ncbi:hypothetical protein BUGL105410_29315 [Burkholderia gladioli]
MPTGTDSITANGIDQLSYKAARHRNTTSTEIAYSAVAWLPDSRSSKDKPVHSWRKPAGSEATSRSISRIASPELTPGAASPWISSADMPL